MPFMESSAKMFILNLLVLVRNKENTNFYKLTDLLFQMLILFFKKGRKIILKKTTDRAQPSAMGLGLGFKKRRKALKSILGEPETQV